MKKYQHLILYICIIFFTSTAAAIEGAVEYNSVNIDYDNLNASNYIKAADNFLYKAELKKQPEDKDKFYYGEALGAYITATEINPQLIDLYGKIGYIYGKLKKFGLAKAYLDKGLNMDIKNPNINYYYGVVCADMENYNCALKYYKNAEKLNYKDKYDINIKLGETNEKLGDLEKAKIAYTKALAFKPDDIVLKDKITKLDELKYIDSVYYYRKKTYFYD